MSHMQKSFTSIFKTFPHVYGLSEYFYRPHTEYDEKVMFSVCLFTGPPPRSRSSGGPQGQGLGQGLGEPPVKVQVKVWGAPSGQGLGQGPGGPSRSRSRGAP